MNRAAAMIVALSLAACSRSAPPAAGEGSPAAAVNAPEATPAFVSAVTALRRQPSDAARVPGPAGKEIANQLAVLQRGERISVLEAGDDWARVRTSDDREGWVRRGVVLEGEGIREATVLAPADVFDRPDLLAANARRKIEAGRLLLVVKTKPPFSEVSVSSGPNAWVLTERLATSEREVSVAKLAEKARWLVRAGKADEARRILAIAREQFADVPLVDQLEAELGEEAAPGEPPASAALPASAPAADR